MIPSSGFAVCRGMGRRLTDGSGSISRTTQEKKLLRAQRKDQRKHHTCPLASPAPTECSVAAAPLGVEKREVGLIPFAASRSFFRAVGDKKDSANDPSGGRALPWSSNNGGPAGVLATGWEDGSPKSCARPDASSPAPPRL